MRASVLLQDRGLEADLRTAFEKHVVDVFRNVPEVISSSSHPEFCALSYEAVVAWLKSDDLVVHSENCVVFLLTAWVNAQTPGVDMLTNLAGGVRFPHLSAMYVQGGMLRHRTWIGRHVEDFEKKVSMMNVVATGKGAAKRRLARAISVEECCRGSLRDVRMGRL